jgi:hypothetical protein
VDRGDAHDRQAAKQAVHDLATRVPMHAIYVQRLYMLIDNPDLLHQGGRAICGLTSIVYTLLAHDVQRFVKLVEGIFDTEWDAQIGCVTIKIEQLHQIPANQMQRKINTVPAHEAASVVYTQLDFMLARAIGVALLVKRPDAWEGMVANARAHNRLFFVEHEAIQLPVQITTNVAWISDPNWWQTFQRDFHALQPLLAGWFGFGMTYASASLTPTHPGRWEFTWLEGEAAHTLILTARADSTLGVALKVAGTYAEGDLPVSVQDGWTIMSEIFCCKEGGYFPLAAHQGEGPGVVNGLLNYPKSFAYGAVTGLRSWIAAYQAALSGAPRTDAAFTFSGAPVVEGWHTLVITGPMIVDGQHYVVPVWTWGRRFTVRIPVELLASYITHITAGFLPER